MVFRVRICLVGLLLVAIMGQGFSQMSWSNIKELTDYKKELKSYLKSAEKKKEDGGLQAKIGECYYMLNQMKQAQSYFEKALVKNALTGDYQLQYAKTLMALKQYPAAKQWFANHAKTNPEVGNHYAAQVDKLEILDKIAPIFSVKNAKQNSNQAEMAVSIVGSDVYFLQDHYAKGKTIQRIFADGSVRKVDVAQDLIGVSYFKYSGNGKMVCYTKQQTFLGQRLIPEAGLNDELYIAAVAPNGAWTNPVKFPHSKSGFNCSYPSLNTDGTILYFSSDRADGFGGQDIYMSLKDRSAWSFPVNVGPTINTPGNEISPYATANSLYFSSNWNVGFGGYDIYRAAKIDGEYKKVFHQGKSVNSSRDDYGFVMNDMTNTSYFISNRSEGSGLEDIFIGSKPDANYVINVKDASSNSSIQRAALDLSACGGDQTFTDTNGQFVFQLTADSGCRIRIEKPGYEITFVEVSKLRGKEYTVMLESNFPTVSAQVLDQSTGAGLADVKVAVENMATKEVQNLVTDNSGSFTCQLISGYTYQIQYFKQGFQSNSKMINTGTRVSKDAIGSILLTKQQAAVASAPSQIGSTPAPTRSTATTSPAPAPYTSSAPYTSPSTTATITKSGYAVQIAAVRPSKSLDMNKYNSSVDAYGSVYVKEGSDYNRVRVGVFATKSEANQAKDKIKAAGYNSAYVVEEEGVTLKSGVEDSYTARSYAPAPSTSNAEYVIRLAALRNTNNVDRSLLNRYGNVETTQSNGLTIFYLSGFSNLSDAKKVTSNLQAQGYPGAYVMSRSNGAMQKVN